LQEDNTFLKDRALAALLDLYECAGGAGIGRTYRALITQKGKLTVSLTYERLLAKFSSIEADLVMYHS
jgi:hypothetical protein